MFRLKVYLPNRLYVMQKPQESVIAFASKPLKSEFFGA